MERNAGFWVRLGASVLDGLLVSLPLGLVCALILGDAAGTRNWLADFLQFLYSLIIPVIWSGYVVGKRILGIRIVKLDGSNVSFGTMFLRIVVGALVYTVTLGIGLIASALMVGTREDKRAIHDLIAGTYVTHSRPEDMN
ncbi:RDD family protein [Neobacillus sp. PS3-34]|uniref:RDD family protein n=1 Tax=Neobacillus sp. PS3-34 TaxID=3070678 RepID=UPI0027DEDBE5|nr:RDD family protein [Neobacillus sp. PS3-34]WML48100.1 RDD family protein [Neobacillus sp. PS3-34]